MSYQMVHPSPATVKMTFTREHAGRALRELRARTLPDSRERNAVNRAALNLESCPWTYSNGMLSIDSATGERVYHVDAAGCDCHAARACRTCWHVWAFAIVSRAQEIAIHLPRRPLTESDYLAVLTAADAMFS